MKTKIVTIQEKDYKIKVGFGVLMQFEDELSKSITDIKGKNDVIRLAYIALSYNNEDFNWTFKAFIDEILDENPKLFIEIINTITSLLFENAKESDNKKK